MSNDTKQQYKNRLARIYSTGNFFIFRREFVTSGLFTRQQALMIQDLINHLSMTNTVIHEDGFFLCTEKYLERSLLWTEKEQRDHLADLEEKGYLEKDRRGIPGRRFLRLNLEKLEEDLDQLVEKPTIQFRQKGGTRSGKKGGTRSGKKGGTIYIEEIQIEELHNHTCEDASVDISFDPDETPEGTFFEDDHSRPKSKSKPDPIFFAWAEMLHSAAEKKSGRKIKNSPIISARAFQAMHKRIGDGVRISDALQYYRSHDIKDRFGATLIIKSPVHFENCLDWIEREMKVEKRKKMKVVPADPNRHDDVI